MNYFYKITASVLGLGYIPVAPGTFGTLGGFLFWLLLWGCSTWVYLLIVVLTIIVSCIVSHGAWKLFGKTDSPHIVVDEFCGFLVSMIGSDYKWYWGLAGFALFRAFDILKPPPVRQAEDLPGGIGVVADDVMAGIYSLIILALVRLFI